MVSERTEAAIGYINIGIEEIDDPRRRTQIEVVRNALFNARAVLLSQVEGAENIADIVHGRCVPVDDVQKRFREFYEAVRTDGFDCSS